MRRTSLIVDKPVEKQKIGTWSGPNIGLNIKSGYMIPYGKSSEDIEVFLRYSNVLKERQLVELCSRLLQAGAEIRHVGDVNWLDPNGGKRKWVRYFQPNVLFILRPKP